MCQFLTWIPFRSDAKTSSFPLLVMYLCFSYDLLHQLEPVRTPRRFPESRRYCYVGMLATARAQSHGRERVLKCLLLFGNQEKAVIRDFKIIIKRTHTFSSVN